MQKKPKNLKGKNAVKQAIICLKEDREFNLTLGHGDYIFYVGGVLSRLKGGVLSFRIGDKWIEDFK